MITNQTQEGMIVGHTEELVFAGDGVRLSGQLDYPHAASRSTIFPLMFVLHHAGCEARSGYAHFAQFGLQSGYAVFRWDKRGTGRSGAGEARPAALHSRFGSRSMTISTRVVSIASSA